MNYTKGEWKAWELLPDKHGIVTKKGWEVFTPEYDVVAMIEHGAPIRKEADAQLIASAPDMYEALKEIYGLLARNPKVKLSIRATRMMSLAITKAEGR